MGGGLNREGGVSMIMPQRGLIREGGLIERGLDGSFTVGRTSIFRN